MIIRESALLNSKAAFLQRYNKRAQLQMNNQTLLKETPLTRRQRAVVVGASSGIGAAIAQRLAQEGFLVAALARRGDLLEVLCAEINAQAGETRAFAVPHSATDLASIPQVFQTLLKDLGSIEVFVYAAGVMHPVALDEFDLQKESEMLVVNLLGAVAWLGQVATLFQRMGEGRIVGISSVSGDRGRVANPAYGSSKAGLDAYLESLRNRLSRHGVQVLTVKPGFVDTQMLKLSPRSFGAISPEQVAAGVWRALQKGHQLVYLPWWWRWIMLAIRWTPSFIFRRLTF